MSVESSGGVGRARRQALPAGAADAFATPAEPAEATVAVTGAEPVTATLKRGTQEIEVLVPAVEKETADCVTVEVGRRG